MKYVYVDSNSVVQEIIPEVNPNLPGFTVVQRYPVDFVAKLIPVVDTTPVEQNWVYDGETFSPPVPEPEPEPTVPTDLEKLRADIDYIAMETGVTLDV